MDFANLASLGPLITLALTAVVAMLLAPVSRVEVCRAVTAAGLAVALAWVLGRAGAEPAPATTLLADDPAARFGAGLAILSGLAALAFFRTDAAAREAPALIALTVLGTVALSAATHAATVFLGLEITSLSLIALFAFPLTRRSLEAAYKYLMMGGAAAALLLLGLALGFAATGTLDLAVWSGDGRIVALGLALGLAALGFKLALVPFHMWTPDVFEGAPTGAAALAGVVAKIGLVILLLRLDAAGMPEPVWSAGLAATGAVSILLGNLLALRQTSLTRMLGYSSIAHSGSMALILAAGGAMAGEALLFYLTAYAPALLVTLCIAALVGPAGHREHLGGLGWRRPLAGAGLALGLLSLAGLPPTIGFFGKVYLFTSLAAAGAWPLLMIAVAGSALAFFYYVRFVAAVYRRSSDAPDRAMPAGLRIPDRWLIGLAIAAIVGAGLYPGPVIDLVRLGAP